MTSERMRSSARPRTMRLALLALLVLMGTSILPSAEATSPILTAEVRLVYHIDVRDLEVNERLNQTATDALGSDDPESGICGTNRFQLVPHEARFTFSETERQTGCGELGYPFQLPSGMSQFTAIFTADREITEEQGAQMPVDAEQSIRVYDENGRLRETFAYYDSVVRTQDAREHRILFNVAMPGEKVNLTWYFADRGFSPVSMPVSVGSGHAFSANVQQARIAFPPAQLGRGTLFEEDRDEREGSVWVTRVYELEVPEVRRTSDDNMTVSVRIDGAANLTGVTAPDGTALDPRALEEAVRREAIDHTIGARMIDDHGAGVYRFVFVHSEPLPPAPPLPPPATVFPLAWLALLLPIFPGAMAVRQGLAFRRRATDRFSASARNVLVAVGAALGVYGILLGYTFFAERLAVMATLPLVVEGWLLFFQLILLAAVLAVLAIYPIRYLSKAMERDLAERTAIMAELERSNRELEQFAYVASHDLQEPLRTISGYTQLLRKRVGVELDEKGHRYIDRTVAGTERMQRLINDLLAYSRVNTRHGELVRVDVAELVGHVLDDMRRLLDESEAKVHVAPLPIVQGDMLQLQMVFSNLLRNAALYRHPERPPVIAVTAAETAYEWRFSVQDNGAGIPEDQFERIFIIFQRLVPREKDDTGTGIGLAISKRIIERHGGRIWVESVLGTGTTFHFTIPKRGDIT